MSVAKKSSFYVARSVHRRLANTVSLALGLALLAAVLVQHWAAREGIQQFAKQGVYEQSVRLVATLNRLGSAASPARDVYLQNFFDDLHLQGLELQEADGTVAFHRQRPPVSQGGLDALDRLLNPGSRIFSMPLTPPRDSQPVARLRIQPQELDVGGLVWRLTAEFAVLLTLLLLPVLGYLRWKIRPLRKQVSDLGQRIAEAQSASQYSSLPATPTHPPATSPQPPATAEVKRLLADIDTQTQELERLRLQAYHDALTGLPKRQLFMSRMESALQGASAWPASTIVLVRVCALHTINGRVGNDAADRGLQVVAKTLRDMATADQSQGAIAGRLNGSDFALLLPTAGAARRKAETVINASRRAWMSVDPDAGLAVGAISLHGPEPVKQVMSLLDEALARAEAKGSFSWSLARHASAHHAMGNSMLQQLLADALTNRRVSLAEYPVVSPDGGLMYLDCPMRVQLEEGAPPETAWRWLAPALRGHFSADSDVLAIQLALQACSRDGRTRCVNVSAQSMGSSDFMARVSRELESLPLAARRLWLDLPESLALEQRLIIVEAARRWRPLGVRLALEHAGEHLHRVTGLGQMGLDAVRVDSSYLSGLQGEDAAQVAQHLRGLVQLIHGSGLSAMAEGVANMAELNAVWALSFDGATGPAIKMPGVPEVEVANNRTDLGPLGP